MHDTYPNTTQKRIFFLLDTDKLDTSLIPKEACFIDEATLVANEPDISPPRLTLLLEEQFALSPVLAVNVSSGNYRVFTLWQQALSDCNAEALWLMPSACFHDYLQQIEHGNAKCRALEAALLQKELSITQLLHSTSWKITAPLRASKELMRFVRKATRFLLRPAVYQRAIQVLRSYGFRKVCKKAQMVLRTQGLRGIAYYLNRNITYTIPDYQRWIAENDSLSDEDKKAIRQHIQDFPSKPLISVIMPVYNVDVAWLRAAIDSVLSQLYPHLELCIADDCSTNPAIRKMLSDYAKKDTRVKLVFREKNGHISESSNSALALATGEFIALLDHDDLLSPHALYHIAYAINKHPEADLLYSDEDKINEKGERYDPYFKSDWNPDLFYGQNMFSHLGVYRRSVVNSIGGFRKGFEGSQDYDLCLRAVKASRHDKIRHVPHILYHWRAIAGSTALANDAKDYAALASRHALQDYFTAVSPGVTITDAASGGGYHRLHWPLPLPQPKITLIIPTRNAVALLSTCVNSILDITDYDNYSILIINNQSDDPETLAYFEEVTQHSSKVRVLDYDAPFNFSSMNNVAVNAADSPLIAFINNDIEAIHSDWLREMVSHAIRPEIGAVGAKLYYPNNTIQHGGVVTGTGAPESAVATHLFHGLTKEDPGYFGRAQLVQSLAAVTAACLVMRKNVFLEAGGFEEKHLTVAFNDVDLCLKVREKGYRILWTPYAELYHHESATRGYEDTPEKFIRFKKEVAYMRQRWGDTLDNDPYYNPNLGLLRGDFTLAFPSRNSKPWQLWQKAL